MPPFKQAPGPRPRRPRNSSLPNPNPNPNPKPNDAVQANPTAPSAAQVPVPRKPEVGIVESNGMVDKKEPILLTEETEKRTPPGEEGGKKKKKKKVKKVRKVVRVVKRMVKKKVPKLVPKGEAVEGREERISGGDGGKAVGKVESLVGVREEDGDLGRMVVGLCEGGNHGSLSGVVLDAGKGEGRMVEKLDSAAEMLVVDEFERYVGAGKIEDGMAEKYDSAADMLVEEFVYTPPDTERYVGSGNGKDDMVDKGDSDAEMMVEELLSAPACFRVEAIARFEPPDLGNDSATVQVPVDGDAAGCSLVEAVNPDANIAMQVEKLDGDAVADTQEEMVDGDAAAEFLLEKENKDLAAEVKAVNAESVGDWSNECEAEVVGTCGGGEQESGKDGVEKADDGEVAAGKIFVNGELEALQRQKSQDTEVFVGGLSRDAKEEDVRKVFREAGEIVEVRLAFHGKTGKNKGFAFVKYTSAADANKALEKFREVEICGKQCSASPVEGNDTIFLGNIDKKWTNEDVTRILQEMGIEKIDKVTVTGDPNNVECNRGFAFLKLETKRAAQIAFRKLQKDMMGKLQKVKVAWAEPLSELDEEELLKVKSVYAEHIPPSWDEDKVRDHFKRFGEIENVVLARNLRSSKRKDFAFVNFKTREHALACIQSFNSGTFSDKGLKVNVKVSLAKSIPKGKPSKKVNESTHREISKQNPSGTKRPVKLGEPRHKEVPAAYISSDRIDARMPSKTSSELERLLAERALQKQTQAWLGVRNPDFPAALPDRKRSFSILGHDLYQSDPRQYTRMRMETPFPIRSPIHRDVPPGVGMTSPYHHQLGVSHESGYRYADYTNHDPVWDSMPFDAVLMVALGVERTYCISHTF
ncbi:hypothetical protein Tsubulata_012793 [Turnera subulata]|uniref:RRM domain-containing protein n=1 Tax=Turnera subulata TaxID=218843 RepID=A0A9Q0FRN3_9ROSI|nr:hypothetical protein Tsubulata_012793 [Turnera subulata]